jgi:bifunctional non-homologous end joining protein LigD
MLLRRVAFPDFCEPCLPSPAKKPPAGAGWLYEIKHDGFRMLVRRYAAGVRLFARNGHDWTGRFPPTCSTLMPKEMTCSPKAFTSSQRQVERHALSTLLPA